MNEEAKLLLPIVASPLIGAVLSILISAIGLPGRVAQVEYQDKRLALIEKLLTVLPEGSRELRQALEHELAEIISFVTETSPAAEELRLLNYDKRIWFRKILPPSPSSFAGTVANVVFYMYAVYPFVFFLAFNGSFSGETGDTSFKLFVILASTTMAILARMWAIKTARKNALIRRSRRLLGLYAKSRGEMTG